MIKIRGFSITYTNAAFLGVGFILGYGKALRDSEDIQRKLDDILNTIVEVRKPEDPEEAAERQAKAEAVPGTAEEIIPELPKESQLDGRPSAGGRRDGQASQGRSQGGSS